MTGKPTPGPWVADLDEAFTVRDSGGGVVAGVCFLGHGRRHGGRRPDPEPRLNAELIATAGTSASKLEDAGYDGIECIKALPELVEALRPTRAVAAYLDRPSGDEPNDRSIFEAAAIGTECVLTAADIRRMARLLCRLTKKGESDDAA